MPDVGDMAPEFALKNQDEQEMQLGDFMGKWMVLYFYPRDNTTGCTLEAKDFTGELSEFVKLGAEVVGISPDSCASHRKFREKHGLAVTLLSDPDKQLLKAYGVWTKKKMAGRKYMGVIRSTYLIDPEGRIAARWTKVKVDGHVEQVRAKLAELKG